ncbi:MAG: RNA polymerase sigma factor [Dehalococcoidia bacterium]
MAEIAAGDLDALGALYARYGGELFAYIRHLTTNTGQAEEVLQDTLYAVWTSAERFAAQGTVRGWLFGVARRQAHNARRRRELTLVRPEHLDDEACRGPSVEDLVIAGAERDALLAAVDALGPMQREILVLTFLHDCSYQELVDALGVPLGTVKSRLHAAKRQLRAALRGEGIER